MPMEVWSLPISESSAGDIGVGLSLRGKRLPYLVLAGVPIKDMSPVLPTGTLYPSRGSWVTGDAQRERNPRWPGP